MKATHSGASIWGSLLLSLRAILVIGWASFLAPVPVALAQGDPGRCVWSEPINLSQSPDDDTTFGQIIGDPSGRVHAFWSERPGEDAQGFARDYVAYRVWDGAAWSAVADILVSPPSKAITFVYDVAISPDAGQIYLLWRNEVGLFVSSASPDNAINPHEWRTTIVASGSAMSGWPRIALDNGSRLHVLLIDGNETVQHTASLDEGRTWRAPTTIWTNPNQGQALDRQEFIIGRGGTLHAAWQINLDQAQKWAAYGVYYSQSTDGGATWTSPVVWESIPRGYADPALFEDSHGTLHLFWNGAAGTLDGRYYAWSEDAGKTWSPVVQLTGGYYTGGRSGAPRLVEDSAGVLHVVHASQMASAGSDSRVVTSYLAGHAWSPPEVVTDQHMGDAPALAITGGNRLHVLLWTQAEPAELLYATCQLPAPEFTPVPTVTRVTELSATPPPPRQASPPASSEVLNTSSGTGSGSAATFASDQPAGTSSGTLPVLVGSFASGALVLTVAGYALLRRTRGR